MAIPANIIIMWSGAVVDIPNGWFLCDGQNGTPNLVDRFVVGAGSTYGLDSTGGSKDAVVVSHTHSISIASAGNHSHSVSGHQNASQTVGSQHGIGSPSSGSFALVFSGGHSHSLAVNNSGESGVDKNMPPYYALAYIMKGAE